jgi:hypothetical protein
MTLSYIQENNIFTFQYYNNLPENTAFRTVSFEKNGVRYYVAATLYSKNVKDLDKHLIEGLEYFAENHKGTGRNILDEMKETLFASGDNLADHLSKLNEPIDDVDYSVCFLGFRDGIVYVWMDGDLNLRIYRGDNSILVNADREPQFFGSTNIQLSDILVVSPTKNLKSNDSNIEKYVLEQGKPDYPAFVLDYQIEYSQNQSFANLPEDNTLQVNENFQEVDDVSQMYNRESLQSEEQGNSRIDDLKQRFGDLRAKIDESGVLGKIQNGLQVLFSKIWTYLMSFSSWILDFFYILFNGNNPHKVKRFQSSPRKRTLQYIVVLLLVLLVGYTTLSLFPSRGDSSQNNGSSTSTGKDQNAQFRDRINAEFVKLEEAAMLANVNLFTSTQAYLNRLIDDARSSNFTDNAFLLDISSRARDLEFDLFNITKVQKADQVFDASRIKNVNLVDFDVLNGNVYAIDRNNNQILVSNLSTLSFDVFASDEQLTAMRNISCAQTSCYITDDEVGLVILNLQTKTFSKFTNNERIRTAGAGANEVKVFLLGNVANIYIHYPSQSSILRFTRVGDGFQNPVTWNAQAGFGSDISDFDIDGGIFEMSNAGVLRRFFAGRLETSFGGLAPSTLPLGSNLQIASTPARETNPNNRNRMYVSDPENERIVVYQKDLNSSNQYDFLGSYKYTGTEILNFSNISQIVLSQDERTLYLLNDNKVIRIGVGVI